MAKGRAVDRPTYTSDPNVLRRFDQRRDIFSRGRQDAQHAGVGHGDTAHAPEDLIHHVLARAAGVVDRKLRKSFLGLQAATGAKSETCPPDGLLLDDPAANAKLVKDTARRFGADLVGICRLNRTWLYSHDHHGDAVELPESHQWVVVMAVAMDPEGIAGSPGPRAAVATRMAYIRMTIAAACVAECIRTLGFGAVATGNDTGLSIPLAIDAGLGEMGRNGLLITPEFGPCVRICKVLTDLPLEADPPVDMGLTKICRGCVRCVAACPGDAIDDAPEPSYNTACRSNNPGILRWPVNAEKCLAFWRRNGGSCSTCIPACPLLKT